MNDGGQAYPVSVAGDGPYHIERGMTLVDWMAGQALIGLLSDSGGIMTHTQACRRSYAIAKEMIAEREHQMTLPPYKDDRPCH